MKKMKFNPIERAAGLFVLLAIFGTVGAGLSVMIKKGFFESRAHYFTVLKNSESVRVGTPVRMAGLRAGFVESVELATDHEHAGQVNVGFWVFEKFSGRVRETSRVNLFRPTIIGEKILDVTVGDDSEKVAAQGTLIAANDQQDLIDALSGAKFAGVIANLERVSAEMANVIQQVSGAGGAAKGQKIVANLGEMTGQIKKLLAGLADRAPQLSHDFARIVGNMSNLTDEFAKMAPKLTQSAESIPATTQKLVELMTESVTLVRAMQRNFLIRGAVADVKQEEEAKRAPASVAPGEAAIPKAK